MKIGKIMTSNPVSVHPTDSLLTATKLLKEKGFKHLPVVNGAGTLVGVVTDRDLKRASASDATTLEVHELLYLLDKITVGQVMTRDPATIGAEESVQTASKLLVDRKIGCLPVVRDNVLEGILTKGDLVELLARKGL
jgi:acetoin utilization protein AcuB